MNRLLSKTADPFFSTGAGALACGATQVLFTYTATGKRASMTDASGTTTYGYDPPSDRLVSKNSPESEVDWEYDLVGNLTRIAGPTNLGIRYTYDQLNRRASASTSFMPTMNYTYDAVGNLAGQQADKVLSTSYTYDPLNRLTNLQTLCGTAGSLGALGCITNTPIASYAYTLGPAGNRLSVAELSGRTVNYGYDDLYRLTAETIICGTGSPTCAAGNISYTFDSVGNRTQRNSTVPAIPATGLLHYDNNDRTSTDPYDANGNLLLSGAGNNVYDFENRLVQAGGVTIVYDGDGNRVQETVAGVTTKYQVAEINPTDYAQVVSELNSSGQMLRGYLWGLQLVGQRDFTDGTFTGRIRMYGMDGHGSVRYLTDANGTVTDTYDYDAFGNLIASTGTTPNNYLFAGEQFDPALGIYYNRARYYDQRQGRFWTMDTLSGDPESPISLHKYLYANADPVSRVDPSGNESLAEAEESLADQLIVASRTTLRILSYYNRAKTILEFIHMATELVQAWHSAGIEKAVTDLIRRARSEWAGITSEAVTEDLEQNLPRVIEGVVFWWPAKLLAEHGRPPDAFGIDLPVPFPMAKIALPIGKLPDTNFRGYVIFGAGGSRWGRVTGLEVQYSGEWEQVWRMDFHGAHDMVGTDLDSWTSTLFHYHVLE